MKVIILAGGLQSTIDNIAEGIPKPMAEVGGKPLLWHIMKNFSMRGFSDFIICGGYKVAMIKEYFKDFYIYQSDITVDLQTNQIQIHKNLTENWHVTVVDTGISTTPGQRILQAEDYIGKQDFIVVHGDCLSNINYEEVINKHEQAGKLATITVARPVGRNEVLPIEDNDLLMKNAAANLPHNEAWVNACCKIFKGEIFPYFKRGLDLGSTLFAQLAEENQIITYKHRGFWSPMETKREQMSLEYMWESGQAPWAIWR